MSSSGYISQSDYRLHFGIGQHEMVESIEIRWPNGNTKILSNIKANQVLNISETE
jgi:hypothetical protein